MSLVCRARQQQVSCILYHTLSTMSFARTLFLNVWKSMVSTRPPLLPPVAPNELYAIRAAISKAACPASDHVGPWPPLDPPPPCPEPPGSGFEPLPLLDVPAFLALAFARASFAPLLRRSTTSLGVNLPQLNTTLCLCTDCSAD